MTWNLGAGIEDNGVVVTGAAGGIGRSVATALAAAGARVCVIDLNQAGVDDVVQSLKEPERHLAVAADLRDIKGHGDILERARDTFGRVDALVHPAAVLVRRPSVADITEDDWDIQLDVNLKATFFLNTAVAELFRAQGAGGRIVNFTSTGWWTGATSIAIPYVASKGGVVSMSRALARSLAPDGITVNTIAPGGVDTHMMREGLTDEQLDAFIATIPAGRLARPEEIASVAVFLVSGHASYVTGATINVSGGQLMY